MKFKVGDKVRVTKLLEAIEDVEINKCVDEVGTIDYIYKSEDDEYPIVIKFDKDWLIDNNYLQDFGFNEKELELIGGIDNE